MAHVHFLAGVKVFSYQPAWAMHGSLQLVCYYILAMQV
jgi:hypothetical protein